MFFSQGCMVGFSHNNGNILDSYNTCSRDSRWLYPKKNQRLQWRGVMGSLHLTFFSPWWAYHYEQVKSETWLLKNCSRVQFLWSLQIETEWEHWFLTEAIETCSSLDDILGGFVFVIHWTGCWCAYGVILVGWPLLWRFITLPIFMYLYIDIFTLSMFN